MSATEESLKSVAKRLCQWLNLKNENARTYVEAVIPQPTMWIGENVRNGNLDNLFIEQHPLDCIPGGVVLQDIRNAIKFRNGEIFP